MNTLNSEGSRKKLAIYLDLNHWYALDEANQNLPRTQSDAQTVLTRLRELRQQDKILLPLSSIHYTEVRENPRELRRTSVAAIMGELSDFLTLAPWELIVQEELALAVTDQWGVQRDIAVAPKFGYGFGFACGTPGQFRISGSDEFMTNLRQQVDEETILKWEAKMNRIAEDLVLQGVRIPNLNPFAARDQDQAELDRINRMVANLKNRSDLRRRPYDLAAASQLTVEIQKQFVEEMRSLRNSGFDITTKLEGNDVKETLTTLINAMPSRRTSVAITKHYLQDLNHRWTINDIRDIRALSIAVPYCDVVITDRQVAHAIRSQGLDTAFNTTVTHALENIENIHLNSQ